MAKKKASRTHKKKKPVARRTRRKKKAVGTTYTPVRGIVHAKAVGSVAYHKSQARKQVEEQLAWLLLARDSAKTKTERNKLTKKVRLKRIELNKLK